MTTTTGKKARVKGGTKAAIKREYRAQNPSTYPLRNPRGDSDKKYLEQKAQRRKHRKKQ